MNFSYTEMQKRYKDERPKYKKLARLVARTVKAEAKKQHLDCTVSHRAKKVQSFATKAIKKRYKEPDNKDWYNDIIDKAGVRVVAHRLLTLADAEWMVESLFHVMEKEDKRPATPNNVLAYRATHFTVKLKDDSHPLGGLTCEVQVLTMAEHLWATVQHTFYKPAFPVPDDAHRTLYGLMALVELFDREVARVEKEMNEEEQPPVARMLHILESLHPGLTDQGYDEELSTLVLEPLIEQMLDKPVEQMGPDMEEFAFNNHGRLRDLVEHNRNNPLANPLIWQPELLLILYCLEQKRFLLLDCWTDILPDDLLFSLADDWSIPLRSAV